MTCGVPDLCHPELTWAFMLPVRTPLIRPPRTARRLIRSLVRSASGWSELGGCSCRPRWGSSPVVVPGVLGLDGAQVPLAEDQHPVGDLGPDGEQEPLRKGIRPGTSGRDLDRRHTGAGQGAGPGCARFRVRPGPSAAAACGARRADHASPSAHTALGSLTPMPVRRVYRKTCWLPTRICS